jgi:hypothetical protein
VFPLLANLRSLVTDLHLIDTGAGILADYGTGSFLVQNVAGTSLLDAGISSSRELTCHIALQFTQRRNPHW